MLNTHKDKDSTRNVRCIHKAFQNLTSIEEKACLDLSYHHRLYKHRERSSRKTVVKIVDEGQLILSTTDTQTIDHFGTEQTERVSFGFSVPHDAPEGKSAIVMDLTTYYPDCREAYSQKFVITLQKSPV
jgi:hypothetical protein